jgi:alpha(1,3/1,4) fucosyltransferase
MRSRFRRETVERILTKIRVAFVHFWPGFDPTRNHFVSLLSRRFDVIVEDTAAHASIVFESHFRKKATDRVTPYASALDGPLKIFFCGEPSNLPIGRHHAVISGNTLRAKRHHRYPLWMLNFQVQGDDSMNHERRRFGEAITYEMTQRALRVGVRPRFACAVFGNPSHFRYEAIRQLSRHGAVDVYGKAVGIPVNAKCQVMRHYRINVCMENTVQPGYVTEKPVEARAAGCLPFWWGDPSYRLDFNERAIINLYEYDLDIERVFDEVDFKEVEDTPLLKRHPDVFNDELELFLYGLIKDRPERLFLDEKRVVHSIPRHGHLAS